MNKAKLLEILQSSNKPGIDLYKYVKKQYNTKITLYYIANLFYFILNALVIVGNIIILRVIRPEDVSNIFDSPASFYILFLFIIIFLSLSSFITGIISFFKTKNRIKKLMEDRQKILEAINKMSSRDDKEWLSVVQIMWDNEKNDSDFESDFIKGENI